MDICYIVGAGDFSTTFSPDESDLVIAADGGYDHLGRMGIRCDLLVGDLDSIKKAPNGLEVVKFPTKKDETDMHLAYLEGVRRGYSDFSIYGGTGGREDHTFANYCLLLYIVENGHTARLLSNTGEVQILKNSSLTLSGEPMKHLSLFPFGCAARGISIKGAEYECEGIDLEPSFPLAVSNRFLDREVNISVKDGTLLVMKEF